MNLQTQDETLVIRGEVFIHDAEALQEALQAYVASANGVVRLDLGEVVAIDTTALQLFIACRHSTLEAEKKFMITGLSPAVESALDLMGLSPLFALPEN